MALDPKRLSPHKARTVPSIVIKATAPDGRLISIGGIKSMERTIDRNMSRRRELDSDIPGVTIEIIPGAVTSFQLTITRAMLYKSALLEGFGINGIEDLIEQNIPLEIHEIRNNLDGSVQTVVYKGCYFKSNPMSIDLDGDWVIMQSAVLEVATAVVTGSKQQANISPDVPGTTFQATAPESSVPKLI
jgi:hypothetical protein